MLWLLTRVVVWPTKLLGVTGVLASRVTAKTAVGSAKVGYRTGRLVGYRRIGLAVAGVAIGLLAAPVPGRELRARLWERLGRPPQGGVATAPTSSPASSSNGSGTPVATAGDGTSIVADPDEAGETGTNPAP